VVGLGGRTGSDHFERFVEVSGMIVLFGELYFCFELVLVLGW
jgi:hypothetical protein